MPLIIKEKEVIYFCHIPKCGGTSVYRMLDNSGICKSFVNGAWHKSTPKWSLTSPQHITKDRVLEYKLNFLFKDSFAMVRNPLDRFISAFIHNKVGGSIPFWVPMRSFLKELKKADEKWHFKYDNHFRPATHFIFDDSKIFKLENEKHLMIKYIQEKFDMPEGTLAYPHEKKRNLSLIDQALKRKHITNYRVELLKARMKNYFVKSKEDLTLSEIRQIEAFYHEDYKAFNYGTS